MLLKRLRQGQDIFLHSSISCSDGRRDECNRLVTSRLETFSEDGHGPLAIFNVMHMPAQTRVTTLLRLVVPLCIRPGS